MKFLPYIILYTIIKLYYYFIIHYFKKGHSLKGECNTCCFFFFHLYLFIYSYQIPRHRGNAAIEHGL